MNKTYVYLVRTEGKSRLTITHHEINQSNYSKLHGSQGNLDVGIICAKCFAAGIILGNKIGPVENKIEEFDINGIVY